MKGVLNKYYNNVRVRVTVVAALDKYGTVLDWWWAVTPHKVPLRNPKKINKDVKVSWQIKGVSLGPGPRATLDWDDDTQEGIKMDKTGAKGHPWDDAWGTPESKGKRYRLTVEPTTPPDGKKSFGYSIFLKLNGQSIQIDPELEYDGE